MADHSQHTPLPDPKWLAVHTGAREEERVTVRLNRQGYFTWLPFERVKRRRRKPGTRHWIVEEVIKPYYSRYTFCALRFVEDSIGAINDTDGVSTVVKSPITGTPLIIPNEVMDALMARADSRGLVGARDEVSRKRLLPGTQVQFVEGSTFYGFLAEVALDLGEEIVILLSVLGSRREVSVPPAMIAEISPEGEARQVAPG